MKVDEIARKIAIGLQYAREQKFIQLVEGKTDKEIAEDKSLRRVNGTTYQGDVFNEGWEFVTKESGETYLEREIQVKLIYDKEHASGGVPTLPEKCTASEAIDAFGEILVGLEEDEIPAILSVVNNGLFLRASALNKPKIGKKEGKIALLEKEKTEQATLMAEFSKQATPDWATFASWASRNATMEFLRNWKKTNP